VLSAPLRNAVSVLLLGVALVGAYVDYRSFKAGIPGPHRLTITAYLVIAIYAGATLILRWRAQSRR
jgi:hypothetical protein